MDTTIKQFECNTCHGVYFDKTPEGLDYFHACPPKRVREDEFTEYPNKRDENIGIKLEGAGRTEVE